jgi:hypothetical protein
MEIVLVLWGGRNSISPYIMRKMINKGLYTRTRFYIDRSFYVAVL